MARNTRRNNSKRGGMYDHPAVPRKSPLRRGATTTTTPLPPPPPAAKSSFQGRRTSPFQKSKRSASYKETLSFLSQCATTREDPDISCMTCDQTGEIETLRIFGEDYSQVKTSAPALSGTFGSIIKFTNTSQTETYAIKSFKESETDDPYFEEIIILMLLKMEKKYPDYLIPAYPVILKDCYFNIMHYKEDTLMGLKNNPELMEKNKHFIFNDILNGLISLAKLSYLYGDLKPANTLYSLKKNDKVKIYLADLGGIAPFGLRHEQNMRDKINEFFTSPEIPNIQKSKIIHKYDRNKDQMIYCITNAPFTFPTKTYPPHANVNADIYRFLCHFFHQIVVMYFFLNNHDIRIYAHNKVAKSEQKQDNFIKRTKIPDQLVPFYLIQTKSDVIRKYKTLVSEDEVMSAIVKDLESMKMK